MCGHSRGIWSNTTIINAPIIDEEHIDPQTGIAGAAPEGRMPRRGMKQCTNTTIFNEQSADEQSSHRTDRTTGSNPRSQHYDAICRVDPINRQLVNGYTQVVIDRVGDGWSCYLVTALFSQLSSKRSEVIDRMMDELHRVYSTLLTRIHRKPRTASPDELPILIGAADLPVYKRDRDSSPLVRCNDSLHFHALLLVPPATRLGIPVEEHFRANEAMYLGKQRLIERLDVRRVTDSYERVVDYVFKTILRGRISYDEGILLLPRARQELRSTRSPCSMRPID